MKFKREGFSGLSDETFDRLVGFDAAGRQRALPAKVIQWASLVVGMGVMGMTFVFGLSPWMYAVGVLVFLGGSHLAQVMLVRLSQAELVRLGRKCPNCEQPLYTPGLSASEAQEQWRTTNSGYCPKCFERIGPDFLAAGEEEAHGV